MVRKVELSIHVIFKSFQLEVFACRTYIFIEHLSHRSPDVYTSWHVNHVTNKPKKRLIFWPNFVSIFGSAQLTTNPTWQPCIWFPLIQICVMVWEISDAHMLKLCIFLLRQMNSYNAMTDQTKEKAKNQTSTIVFNFLFTLNTFYTPIIVKLPGKQRNIVYFHQCVWYQLIIGICGERPKFYLTME